ncbi:hypothetical protein JoomaDRAFT_1781 [Galbibacter orientalis DSM 19592]|uniref:CHAT domain-containing protein n=1 Tax=Galbibacter orientalis DSM 19592 TaxID=926559 RepID=I3C595_9FLAO|nr:CHAT domain-containing protein [Galbibacter orientalis]EIJ38788.1 hypothetical protein JoomaDRAFT_1781 [Galbibacter orientalis DSM 19592]
MRKVVENISGYILLIIFGYIIISFLHLTWYIASPDGFFGFLYFTELLRTLVFALVFLFLLIVIFTWFLSGLKSFFKKKSSMKDIFKLICTLVFMASILLFNYFSTGGISLYFAKILSDKYEDIKETEELIDSGEYKKAFEIAESKYYNIKNRSRISNFFFLTQLYSKTKFDQRVNLVKQYSATINYGFCLLEYFNSQNEAEKVFKEAINIANNKLIDSQKDNLLLFPLLSLGELKLREGDYFKADDIFSELTNVLATCSKQDLTYLINSQLLFADRLLRVGDYRRFQAVCSNILNLYIEKGGNQKSKTYASLLMTASLSNLLIDNFDSAGRLLVKATSIAERNEGHPIYINYLYAKAHYCFLAWQKGGGNEELLDKSIFDRIMGKKIDEREDYLNEAIQVYDSLLGIIEDKYGINSISYVSILMQIADFNLKIDEVEKAREIYKESLTLIKNSSNYNKEIYFDVLLKNILFKKDKNQHHEEIISSLRGIEKNLNHKLINNFLFLNQGEKELFVTKVEKDLNLINSIYVDLKDSSANELLYNNLLAMRQIALRSEQNFKSFVKTLEGGLLKEYQELKLKRRALEWSSGVFDSDSLNIILEKERKLIKKITSMDNFRSVNPRQITWENIRDRLNMDELAIETFTIKKGIENNENEIDYYALVINNKSTSPELVYLFNENILNEYIDQANNKDGINAVFGKNKHKINKIIFDSLKQYMANYDKYYFSPTGILNKVPYSAILDSANMGSTFSIVSSTNNIRYKKKRDYNMKAALFGGVNYNLTSKNVTNNIAGLQEQENIVSNINRSSSFSKLKYTLDEVVKIKELFDKSEYKEPFLYTGNSATESVMRVIPNQDVNVLHIATHGYYYHSSFLVGSSIVNKIGANMDVYDNPLMRCGLLLAGANHDKSYDKNNDGILTGQEITYLDFSNIDLLVLSACETGLGELKGQEGVFGLQRAFKRAGVKSMIISLWKVPDEQTSQLMVAFYKHYLKGNSANESLQKAQNEIKINYPDPVYWAGFQVID